MFYCSTHNWYSGYYQCPICPKSTTSTNIPQKDDGKPWFDEALHWEEPTTNAGSKSFSKQITDYVNAQLEIQKELEAIWEAAREKDYIGQNVFYKYPTLQDYLTSKK